jgi:hypothetical protein
MFIYTNNVSTTVFKNVKPSFCIPMPLLTTYIKVVEKYHFDPKYNPLKTNIWA